ncbi:MAG: UV DNA damage repair endonuclease UvsE [Clostridiales bacterium]|nr:UV DNA damage repair endonuclease UvsE [Clostridiales bacterium]
MINKVGYACINEHFKPETFKSCRLKTIKEKGIKYLRTIILHNLELTYNILNWNIENNIFMYRATSDLMPLVTHRDILELDDWRWFYDDEILDRLRSINEFVMMNQIRLSMHPDQFTVLNSPREKVVKASISYLEYHEKLLSLMGGSDLIIHVGGVYGDKVESRKRFINQYRLLSDEIKYLIRIENDDKSYTIFDVLEISELTGVKVVFDYHHHRCLSGVKVTNDLIQHIENTWQGQTPKMHISSGKTDIKDRRHHDYISVDDSRILSDIYSVHSVDVMVEAKKKEFAALKLMADLSHSQ